MRLGARFWIVALLVLWGVIMAPYVAAGPDDLEEYFTGVVTTRVAMRAVAHGAWPWWNLDFGLGMPQPFRFHFITHPLAPLCAVGDCHAVLRLVASLHVLVGAFCMGLLTIRFTGKPLLASVAGISFCLSSSIVQPMFVDDWPITVINDSALPCLLYCVLSIGDAPDRRHALLWTAVLGGAAGLLLSMSIPIVTLTAVAMVALGTPAVVRQWRWLLLAASVALVIGFAQVYNLYGEWVLTPATVLRRDHVDLTAIDHLWSVFFRPLRLNEDSSSWRTIFFGPPLAVAALWAALSRRYSAPRPLVIGLLAGVLGFAIPPAALFNIITAQWIYRTEFNVFGILLGVWAVGAITSRGGRARWVPLVAAVQILWLGVAAFPVWHEVFAAANGGAPNSKRLQDPPRIAREIGALHAATPGRVMFAPRAHSALRSNRFNSDGLAPNQLELLGIPTLSTVAYGITVDDLYPMMGTLEGTLEPSEAAVRSQTFLDVLGVRYVVAFADETVAPQLREVKRLVHDLLVYENPGAWPEAFFVDTFPASPLPRLPTCGHSRFLCADFGGFSPHRLESAMTITRLHDGLRLSFPPSADVRDVVITQWYRPEWAVTEGKAAVMRVAEQLVGVRVGAGERVVAVRFRPRLRAALFSAGILAELLVGCGILALVFVNRFARTHR